MVRGLARRRRQAASQSLQQQKSRSAIPAEEAARSPPRRKPYPTAHAIAQSWAQAAPRRSNLHEAARDLAETLAGVKGRIPAATILGLAEMWKARYAPWSVFNRLVCLRRILRAIDAELRTSLASAVPKMKKPPARRVTATPEEIAALLQHATPAMRLFVSLMAVLALRFREAGTARKEDYRPDTQTLVVLTKGGSWKEFPAPDEIARLIELVPAGPGNMIEQMRGVPTGLKRLRQLWHQLKKKAGIRKEVNPHDLRRTAAVRLYTLTKDVLATKELLGHLNLDSTAHYLQPYQPKAMQQIRTSLAKWTPKGETVQ